MRSTSNHARARHRFPIVARGRPPLTGLPRQQQARPVRALPRPHTATSAAHHVSRGSRKAAATRSWSLQESRSSPSPGSAELRVDVVAGGSRVTRGVRIRSSSSGQSAPTAWLLCSPNESTVDDLPDARDQISSPRSAPAPSARTGSGDRHPCPVRSCPSSSRLFRKGFPSAATATIP